MILMKILGVSRRASRGFGAIFLLLLFACAPAIQWVTPAGIPISGRGCLGEDPEESGGPGICYRRPIQETRAAVDQCNSEGGEAGMFSTLDRRFSCGYPAADAGKSCSSSKDCKNACYAETRQCSAFGSTGLVLDENGNTVEVVE